MSDLPCPVCAEPGSVFYSLPRHKSDAFKCSGCRFVWLSPPLRNEDSDYEEHYRDPDYIARFQSDRAKYERHFRDIEAVLPLDPSRGRKVLEVGSSFGGFLRLFAERGFEAQGLELMNLGVQASRASGLTIHQVPLEKFSSAEPFDLIVSTHVVEHLRDIRDYFQKTSDLLAPGGMNVFLTPNADAWLFRLLGKYWAGATPNEHNLFVSAKAVTVLAHEYGFEVRSVTTTGRFWPLTRGVLAEILHSLQSRNNPHKPQKSDSHEPAKPQSARTNRDRLLFLISKIESPFLRLIHSFLAPRGLSDELLVVLQKKSR